MLGYLGSAGVVKASLTAGVDISPGLSWRYIALLLLIFVKQHLLLAISSVDNDDQFAFRPTGSTTAALIYILHGATLLPETNDYVRCLLVDLSKAFDTVNHSNSILIEKLLKVDITPTAINWIINFLTDRTQKVVINGRRSSNLSITRSILSISILSARSISCVNTLIIYRSFPLNTLLLRT